MNRAPSLTVTVGPVVSVGPGGASALDAPSDVRVLPMTDLEAARFVGGSRIGPRLEDGDRAALEQVLLRVGALVEEVPELTELALNPLILRDGSAVVTQALASVRAVAHDPRPPVRRA